MSDGKVISLTDRAENIDRGKAVAVTEAALHEYFKGEDIPAEIAMTALMSYCARIAVSQALSRNKFVAAAKETYKAVAKELRG